MATALQEKTAFDIFLSKLPPEKAQQIRNSLNNRQQEKKAFLVYLGEVFQENSGVNLEGHNFDSVSDAAGAAWDQQFSTESIPQETRQPSKGPSLSDFFPHKESSGGGGLPIQEKNPLLSLQEEQLLKEDGGTLLKLIAEMQKDPEKITDEQIAAVVKNLDARVLLKKQHQRLLDMFQKYVDTSNLTQDQKRDILDTVSIEFNEKNAHASLDYKRKMDEFEKSDEFSNARTTNNFLGNKDALKTVFKAHTGETSEEVLRGLIRRQQNIIAPLSPTLRTITKVSPLVPSRSTARFLDEFERFFYKELQMYQKAIAQQALLAMTAADISENESFPQNSMGHSTPASFNNPRQTDPIRSGTSILHRGAKKLAKGFLRKGVEKAVQAAATNPESWPILVPILIGVAIAVVVAIIVAIIVILIVAFSSQSATPPTPILTPTCSPSSDCVAKLHAIGINVSGDLFLNGDPLGKAKPIYETLALVTQPPSDYGNLLGLPKQQVNIVLHGGSSCAGHASGDGTLDYYGWCYPDVINRFMMLHELGHMIAFRNPVLYWKDFFLSWLVLSFSNKNLPTYNCQLDYGPGPWGAECWADMIGEYVVYPSYRNTVSGRPYGPSNFLDFPTFANGFYYNFARDHIYKGLQFK